MKLDGMLIINKPDKCTSHDIVFGVKKLIGSKIGHTGTLDPMATGVLPILVGEGTKASKYFINHDKKYQVTLQLGKRTDTADSEGNVIEEKTVLSENLEAENVEKVLKKFIGKQEQTPPIYSAIKIKGKKLYEYARKGQTVEIPSRIIEIYDIKLIKIDKENKQIFFEVSCSKGTYIRSLCEDIAIKGLQTLGYMKNLNRIQVGDFSIEQAVNFEEFKENFKDEKYLEKHFISLETMFINKPLIEIEQKKLKHLINGVGLTIKKEDGIYRIYSENKFIGIGTVTNETLKRDILII